MTFEYFVRYFINGRVATKNDSAHLYLRGSIEASPVRPHTEAQVLVLDKLVRGYAPLKGVLENADHPAILFRAKLLDNATEEEIDKVATELQNYIITSE